MAGDHMHEEGHEPHGVQEHASEGGFGTGVLLALLILVVVVAILLLFNFGPSVFNVNVDIRSMIEALPI